MAARCTYHCSPCGRHFHSLKAFDIHHVRDDTGWPVCLDPLDLEDRGGKPRLAALTEHGSCHVYADAQQDVTIWTTADYARARTLKRPPDVRQRDSAALQAGEQG